MWGGLECTINRVGDQWFDQIARTGHDGRPDDIDRIASLGLAAVRYPLLWERLAPRAAHEIDVTSCDARLTRLRELGIRPIAGLLHHGSGPRYTSLLDPSFPDQLARYAEAVARRYPWITDYTPINEPLTTARFSGLYGHWYPHRTDNHTFVRILLNQVRATVLAMRAIRRVTPDARLIQTDDCGSAFGTPSAASQAAFERERKWLAWDLLAGRVVRGHPLYRWLIAHGAGRGELARLARAACPPDLVGLNYYLTSDRFLDERLERYPASSHGGNDRLRYADVEAVRARDEGIVGHEAHLVEAWERYRLPVAITEVHLAGAADDQARWLIEAWRGAEAARSRGADVRAVTAWALLGSFDWNCLVTREAGCYEPGVFDVLTAPPAETPMAAVVRDLAGGREPSGGNDAPGWWRLPERMLYARSADEGIRQCA